MGKLREPLLECSLPAALEAVGERWSFLILRASFNGLHHFEEFQSELGIARNILANRLGRLVGHGILARQTMPEDRRKIAYGLTDKGFALAADDDRAAPMGRAVGDVRARLSDPGRRARPAAAAAGVGAVA